MSALTAFCSRPTSRCVADANDTTWPRAWTPESVRPATDSRTSSRITRVSTAVSSLSIVRPPGSRWRAHPRNPVPSYARVSRITRIRVGVSSDLAFDQLDPSHRRTVARPRPQLEDPRVPALAIGEARPDLVEQPSDDVAVRDVLQHLSPCGQVAPLGERD